MKLVETDGTAGGSGKPVLVEHGEHCTNPIVGAERTPPVNPLETADRLAAGTDLAEEAKAARRLVRP